MLEWDGEGQFDLPCENSKRNYKKLRTEISYVH